MVNKENRAAMTHHFYSGSSLDILLLYGYKVKQNTTY